MKNRILILAVALILSSCATKSSFHTFYQENKQESDFSISISAFIGNMFIPKKDLGEYKSLLRKAKNYDLMVFSDSEAILDKKLNKFIKRKKYSTIFRVAENGDKVQLYFLKDNNMIKEILLKVKSENDYVLIGAKTKILEEDLNRIIKKSELKITSN